MITDPDMYRSANVLIRDHGEEATLEAGMRADAMLEHGDLDGYAVWKRIVKTVDELLAERPPPDATIH